MDKQTNEPLIGATVSIKGTGNGTATDVDGKFQLKVTEKPPFTLLFSYIGYSNQEIAINNEAELKRSFNLKLSTSETILKDVEIVDSRITEKQKESPLTVESMGLGAIKQTASSTFYEGLGTLKGVDMTAASLGFVIINTRGFNSTRPVRSLQLLDGADNQAPGFNFSIGNFAGATEIDIQKVDLIVGASSSLYGPNAFNGVINLQTKNPFYYTGLTVFLKGAERNLFEAALRYARSFKNKNGLDKFAFKLNFSYLRADDWRAANLSPSTNSPMAEDNPAGYDAVNRYGDELTTIYENDYNTKPGNRLFPGLKQFFRTGYLEKDIVNYNVRNLKANAALHYKITDKIEARVAYNFGTGTTVYQGDNRYSLKGIMFNHIRGEIIQPDKFYIRAYATMENGGNSYDAVFTAIKLNELDRSNNFWNQTYQTTWSGRFVPKVRALPGFPAYVGQGSGWFTNYDSTNAVANAILKLYQDSLIKWHNEARLITDTTTYLGQYGGRVEPGTAKFDSLVRDITARTAFEQGGTGFYDRSKMVHVQGEYKFEPKLKGKEKSLLDILVGASFRMYLPDSRGTIFSDTISGIKSIETRINERDSIRPSDNAHIIVYDTIQDTTFIRKRITNWEVGMYLSLSRKFTFGMNEKHAIILTATCRVDKNKNFPFIATPAASVVYNYKQNHTFRVSFSSAIRNPTLQDQYLYYNVGRAILIGNLKGVDSLVTIQSFQDYAGSSPFNAALLSWFDVPPVRPERVQSLEVGYKGIIKNKVYIDCSAYVSWYKDFLGYRIGAAIQNLGGIYGIKQVYRVSANSPDRIMTYGASVGFSYFFVRNYSLSGNYSWNRLDKLGSSDPVIPAYNTPEHKFNVGISGKDIKIKTVKGFGFNINYKYIHGFTFEGSPQFTGAIPTYSLLDAQISWECQKIYTTFKLGGSNLISKMNYQTYGGPAVGRMIYGSILVNLDQDVFEQKLKKGYQSVKTEW